jgi:hypothetical protein
MTSRRLRLVTGIIFSLAGIIVTPTFADAPDQAATVSTLANTTSTTMISTTTTSTVPAPPDARCPMWWSLALSVGFTAEQMPTLDRVLHRESRCDETQLNASDPNGGSIGLTQINRFWCLPSRYYPDGYLQTMQILDTCDQLYEPLINLRAALALVEYSRSVGLSDWHQWAWL